AKHGLEVNRQVQDRNIGKSVWGFQDFLPFSWRSNERVGFRRHLYRSSDFWILLQARVASMPEQTDVGVLRWGPGHGGGPLSMPHHSPTPAEYNPVTHPFGAG